MHVLERGLWSCGRIFSVTDRDNGWIVELIGLWNGVAQNAHETPNQGARDEEISKFERRIVLMEACM